MGRKFGLFAAAAALVVVAGACTAPPALQPALVVNTTADTFDGICDATDCSLRDAIVAHNNRPADPTGVPSRISVPTGTYTLSTATPLTVTKPLIIGGANSALTTLDITGSTVAAPGGVFAAEANIAFTGFTVTSNGASPSGVLASCDPAAFGNRTVSILNTVVTGLEAATATCASVFVSTTVTGPAAVIDPVNLSASSATLPLASGTLSTTSFSFVSSILTGPSDGTGSSDAEVTFTARTPGVPTAGSFTGTRSTGLGFTFGDGTDAVNVNSLNSSFGLGAAAPAVDTRPDRRCGS